MEILIIYAHPKTIGHCSTVLDEVMLNLDLNKKKYELLDLYKMHYDPKLSAEELYTAGNFSLSEENISIQQKIKKAETLIFIYPMWWNTMPAILKGFFDRVLTPKFGYVFEENRPEGLLKGKKAIVFITSGSSNLVSRLFLGNRAVKIIKKDILGFCGITTKVHRIGSANKLTDENILLIKKVVKKALG